MSQNHYQVLGIAMSAPAADIKQAYRRLATQLHPDKHQGSPYYEERFKAVAVAYGVLSDPDRRAQYDFRLRQAALLAQQRAAPQPTAPAQPRTSPSAYQAPTPDGPAAQPLRTRRPAGARERHYQPRATRRQARFNRQDMWLVAGIAGLLLLFGLSVKVVLDRVAASSNLADARAALARHDWLEARQRLDESLGLRPDQAPALQLRGQLAQDVEHNPQAARTDYEAALLADIDPLPPPAAAQVLLRLGECQLSLHHAVPADVSFSRALLLDSTLAPAYLARGQNRLLELGRVPPALADLRRGHRLLARARRPVPLPALQAEGAALARLGRYAEARATYQQALAAAPHDGRTNYLLGRLAQQAADSVSACEFFRRGAAAGYGYAEQAAAGCR